MEQDIATKRGRKKLNHEGFLYVFEKLNKDGNKKYWKCEFFGKDVYCKGRLQTGIDDNVLKMVGIHACPAGAENTEVQRVVTALKRRAIDTMEPPAVLRANVMQNVPTPILAKIPSKEAMKKVVKRARGEENRAPVCPINLEQLIIPQAYQNYTRSDETEENFLIGDSGVYFENGRQQRVMVFGRSSHANWANQMKELYADGTFSLAPSLFEQVYTVLARRENWVFPIFYGLLTSKSHATYELLWNIVKGVWPDFHPQAIHLDFELAAINAIRSSFPFCDVRGCLFHLTQN